MNSSPRRWNPYAVAPTDSRLALLRDPNWYAMPMPEIPTMYPTFAQLVFRATRRLLPDPVGFKLPFLLAGWIRSTGGRNYQGAIYAWNPLVVVEFASSGHNDALAIAGVVATLMIIRRAPPMSTLTPTAGDSGLGLPCRADAIGVLPRGLAREVAGRLAAGGGTALGQCAFGRTGMAAAHHT